MSQTLLARALTTSITAGEHQGMRVGLVVPEFLPHPGGIQRHVEELANGLARRGISVDVLAQEKDRTLPPNSSDGPFTVRRFSVPLSLPRYSISPALLRYLRRNAHSYDVVHAHNYHELVPLFAAVSKTQHLVLTPHYHAPSGRALDRVLRRPHQMLMRYTMRSVDRMICVTQAESEALACEITGLTSRTLVIPNGVDTDRLTRAVPMVVEKPYVLSVGRLEAYKRVDLTIQASGLLAEGTDLVVAGDGPDRTHLEQMAAPFGSRVRFLGRIDDEELHRWIRGASVVVTMSEREAFGLVILEAFAAGVPVVATDIPAHRETADYGPPDASSLVPAGADPKTLAASVTRMITSGPHGFQAVVPTWDDMAARTLAMYQELTANRSA